MSDGNGAKPDGYKSGAELRAMREQGVWQTLSSGLTVRMRTVSPDMLMASGKIPDMLSPLVSKMMFQDVQGFELADFIAERERQDQNRQWVDSLNAVCKVTLLDPRIVDEPQAEDEIRAEDLLLADRRLIFMLALLPAEVLRNFRAKQAGNVEAVPDGEDDEQPTEPLDVREGQASRVPV